MDYIKSLSRLCGGIVIGAVVSFAAASGSLAAGIKPDCTDPVVNEIFRHNVNNVINKRGEPLEDLKLKVVGRMKPWGRAKGPFKEGEEVICHAHLQATIKSGHSGNFEARVYFSVRHGQVDYLKFKLLPRR